MKIYYIEIDKFKEKYDKLFLKQFCDKEFKNEKRFFEYSIGRFLVKSVAKEIYGIKDTTIVLKNSKPIFQNADLFFNISHSNNIVIACFDKFPCGIDIEFAKNKDLERLSKYFNQDFKTQEDFYKFWTLKEASYKLGTTIKDSYHTKLDNYYICITSNNKINIELMNCF